MVIPPAEGRRRRDVVAGKGSGKQLSETQRTTEFLDVAGTKGPVQQFVDGADEVVKGTDWWQGCGEGVVASAAGGGHDEGIGHHVKGDSLVVELAGEDAVGLSEAAEDAGGGEVQLEQAPHVSFTCGYGVNRFVVVGHGPQCWGSRSEGPSMRTVWQYWRSRESRAVVSSLCPRKPAHCS